MGSVIIDVRSKKEFSEFSIPGAINIPSDSYTIEEYFPFKEKQICLVCESGNRAYKVSQELEKNGFEYVSLLDRHMGELSENLSTKGSWTIDRQFRLILAIFLAVFLIGIYFQWGNGVWLIPLILFAGLTFSALTNNCYLKILIAHFPWNRQKE
ncbi:rhodanese-like domain-containing protein [Algoriphagus limi]|uniref:Rhodanese-like domain-containing protein n=1 Tax=Algoriphagus limi TaxID=2975273 RepID=A0ABT2G2J5_9BACT|nr:rhodanese-like domain-containing protein [Algoriphagus limi]MCS5489481.1 rhodanese-like domain-containing protein [Algoriphagus limi]